MKDFKDKLDNNLDKAKGKANETIGEITDDKSQELKGKFQQKKAEVEEAFEDMKDKVSDKIKDVIDGDDD